MLFEKKHIACLALEWKYWWQTPKIHNFFVCKGSPQKINFSRWMYHHYTVWRYRNTSCSRNVNQCERFVKFTGRCNIFSKSRNNIFIKILYIKYVCGSFYEMHDQNLLIKPKFVPISRCNFLHIFTSCYRASVWFYILLGYNTLWRNGKVFGQHLKDG